jgi:hypothetical protein
MTARIRNGQSLDGNALSRRIGTNVPNRGAKMGVIDDQAMIMAKLAPQLADRCRQTVCASPSFPAATGGTSAI